MPSRIPFNRYIRQGGPEDGVIPVSRGGESRHFSACVPHFTRVVANQSTILGRSMLECFQCS